MKRYLFPLLMLFVLIATRAFTIHNAFDSLPSARAFVSDWLSTDWYLSQKVPYRFLFNTPAGLIYEWTNFWTSFFSLKFIQLGLFAYIFSKLLPKLGLGMASSLVFLFLFSSNQSMVAGEWIYGDSDGKPFAYLMFFFGLNYLLEKRYLLSSAFLGLAASFHVLVGGYLSILYFAVRLIQNRKIGLKELLVYGIGGAGAIFAIFYELSLPLPPVKMDYVYVMMRVPHHVLPNWKLIGWLPEYIIYNLIFIFTYKKTNSVPLKTLILFVLLSNIFWITGLSVYWLGKYEMLKYYFFRVADTLFPFTAFLVIAHYLDKFFDYSKKVSALIIVIILSICTFQFSTRAKVFFSSPDKNADMYEWIKKNTKKDAVFLVDPTISDFYISAERPMVISYKNFTQIKSYFPEALERLKFASQLELDHQKPLERDLLSKSYKDRDPELNFANYSTYNVSYVVSEKSIPSERFKLVFTGLHNQIYQVLH